MRSGQKNNRELNICHGNAIMVQMLPIPAITLKRGSSEAFGSDHWRQKVLKEKVPADKPCRNNREDGVKERIYRHRDDHGEVLPMSRWTSGHWWSRRCWHTGQGLSFTRQGPLSVYKDKCGRKRTHSSAFTCTRDSIGVFHSTDVCCDV